MEDRLQREAICRLQDLGRTLAREWDSLRRIHDEPLNQLRDQVMALTETLAVASARSHRELERAEARPALLESDLGRHVTEFGTHIEAAVAALNSPGDSGPPRETAAGGAAPPRFDGGSPEVERRGEIPPDLAELSARLDAFEHALAKVRTDTTEAVSRRDRTSRISRAAIALAAVSAIALAVLALRLQSQVGAAPVREEPAADMVAAAEATVMARTMSEILAAPDLIRYPLSAEGTAGRGTGLLLLSRSRGFAFTGARLLPPPEDRVYQIWLLTPSGATSVGTFRPDASGRVTLASDALPSVQQPVINVTVTVEPGSGSEQPSRTVVLARAPQ
jgi:hypothetical protein